MKGVEMRKKVERELHGVVLASDEALKKAPYGVDWRYDLRSQKRSFYAPLLRFLDAASANGKTPRQVLKVIPGVLDEYIDGLYPDEPSDRGKAA